MALFGRYLVPEKGVFEVPAYVSVSKFKCMAHQVMHLHVVFGYVARVVGNCFCVGSSVSINPGNDKMNDILISTEVLFETREGVIILKLCTSFCFTLHTFTAVELHSKWTHKKKRE